MLIPKHYRKQLKAIGIRKWSWDRIWDWAFGERYRFKDWSIAYVKNDEIITIRKGDRIIWKKADAPEINCMERAYRK